MEYRQQQEDLRWSLGGLQKSPLREKKETSTEANQLT